MNESRTQSRKKSVVEAVTLDKNSAEAMPYLEAAIPIGLAGAGAVAGFVFLLDLIAGQPFGTPNALGAAIFRGMAFDLSTPIAAINIFSFTLIHTALFIVAAAAAITAEFTLSNQNVPLRSQFLLGIASLFAALQVSIQVLMLLLDIPVADEFGLGRLFAINALAAMVMAIAVYHRAYTRSTESEE